MALACISLAGLALLLESAWRAPGMDDEGRIVEPSLRDTARARRAAKRATPTGDRHGRRSSRSR